MLAYLTVFQMYQSSVCSYSCPSITTQSSEQCLVDCCTCSKIPAFSPIVHKHSIHADATLLHHRLKWHELNFSNTPQRMSIRLRSGECEGHGTGPHLPIHCSPKIWFRCCPLWKRKWGGALLFINQIWVYIHRGTSSMSPHVTFCKKKKLWYVTPVSLLCRTLVLLVKAPWYEPTHQLKISVDALTAELHGGFNLAAHEYCRS